MEQACLCPGVTTEAGERPQLPGLVAWRGSPSRQGKAGQLGAALRPALALCPVGARAALALLVFCGYAKHPRMLPPQVARDWRLPWKAGSRERRLGRRQRRRRRGRLVPARRAPLLSCVAALEKGRAPSLCSALLRVPAPRHLPAKEATACLHLLRGAEAGTLPAWGQGAALDRRWQAMPPL